MKKRTKRRNRYAQPMTKERLYNILTAPTVRQAVKLCVQLTRVYQVEWQIEVMCQFRGSIVANTPPIPGTEDHCSSQDQVRRQLRTAWHLTKRRTARLPRNSTFTILYIHSVPLKRGDCLRGLPSICHTSSEGDLACLRQLRHEICRNHACHRLRPIGIEIRVAKQRTFCTLFQERLPCSEEKLKKLDRKLRYTNRVNGHARQLFADYDINLIETQVGRRGFTLTPDELEPFAFEPLTYNGR